MDYEELAGVLKALADPNRLKIIDLLSGGSLCACHLLDHFAFTQPTLSHHMKVLAKAGIVEVTKEGTWHHYQLTESFVTEFMESIGQLFLAPAQASSKKTSETDERNR
ncbi:metalloregulator ArsR/SmtB family transcription factor [Enterococcus pseudoavium]|uniref:Metalloregulator ArsR/SmtB family transcription factor n=1 Tax=Enterococcus pseudoavium TaxID=44007 RepID=A0AAE4L2F0_9ENTE|nr:metalloregulator ArsR/SmtB family transcription factor [Enterococcus pseudoavium]MDT2735709.1 metalloregulator ArsR/SmtB family transcription factor [Enterococcus pseudoavium]REC31247.1 transcriptional regulator [Enterococcus pseudoavium]